VDTLLQQACERLQNCGCLEGCLECCNNDQCKHANQVISKAGARVVIMCILGREDDIDIDALPWGEEDTVQAGIETVVEAEEVRMAGGRRAVIAGDEGKGGGKELVGGGYKEEDMARAKLVDGVWVKVEEEEDDHFSRSIDMYRGERTYIGVHKGS
jgi:DEAD/DEAH box helicase domain-containing protein